MKTESREYIEFTAKRNNIQIEDFKDENKIVEKGDYTLIINDGMEM